MTEITITGLAGTERVLSRLPGIVEDAAEDAAGDVAANEVPRIVTRARSVGRQAQLAARSVRVGADGIVAATGGGVPAAIFYGAEFGGGGRPTTRQFRPFRGTRGYWFWPQLLDDADRIAEQVGDAGLEPAAAEWGRD